MNKTISIHQSVVFHIIVNKWSQHNESNRKTLRFKSIYRFLLNNLQMQKCYSKPARIDWNAFPISALRNEVKHSDESVAIGNSIRMIQQNSSVLVWKEYNISMSQLSILMWNKLTFSIQNISMDTHTLARIHTQRKYSNFLFGIDTCCSLLCSQHKISCPTFEMVNWSWFMGGIFNDVSIELIGFSMPQNVNQ